MDTLDRRHIDLIKSNIDKYRAGQISLNFLSQQIQTLSSSIEEPGWWEAALPMISDIESANAAIIETKSEHLNLATKLIDRALTDLEKLAMNYRDHH